MKERKIEKEAREQEKKTAGFHSKCAQIIGYIVRMSHIYVK